ncbi:hypothetical protein CT3_27390 [Comamonas terrigena NBRC 13299]|nr:hypothetical protein CT3_27390 [Comamonas terrigena NBRC 13299]
MRAVWGVWATQDGGRETMVFLGESAMEKCSAKKRSIEQDTPVLQKGPNRDRTGARPGAHHAPWPPKINRQAAR